MKKVTKRISIFLIVAILVTYSFSMAFAENKVITIYGLSEEYNVDISNVVDEKVVEVDGGLTYELYVANGHLNGEEV